MRRSRRSHLPCSLASDREGSSGTCPRNGTPIVFASCCPPPPDGWKICGEQRRRQDALLCNVIAKRATAGVRNRFETPYQIHTSVRASRVAGLGTVNASAAITASVTSTVLPELGSRKLNAPSGCTRAPPHRRPCTQHGRRPMLEPAVQANRHAWVRLSLQMGTIIHRGGMRTSCSPLMFSTTPRHSMPTYGSVCSTSAHRQLRQPVNPCPFAVGTRHVPQPTHLLAKVDLLAHVGDGYLLRGGHQQSAIHRCSDQRRPPVLGSGHARACCMRRPDATFG